MYDLNKAVSRFQFRFSKNSNGEFNNFKPNKDDVDSINCILNWINNQKKAVAENNPLFAKLLVYQYIQNIRHYETTVLSDLNFAQRDLCKVLDYPLELLFKSFHNDIHLNQLNKLNKNNEINKNIDIKIQEIHDKKLIVDNILLSKYNGLDGYINHLESTKITDKQQIEIIKSIATLKETFTFDCVSDKLNDMISEAYNRFNK